MAELADRYEDNVIGRYFVDAQCIDCDLCRETAPNNFTRQTEEGYSYVYKQPDNSSDADLCADALDECPVEAIGDDG